MGWRSKKSFGTSSDNGGHPKPKSDGWFRGDASDPSGPAATGSGRRREGISSSTEPDTETHRNRVRGPDYRDGRTTVRNFGRRPGQ